jgi:hypothetical protein
MGFSFNPEPSATVSFEGVVVLGYELWLTTSWSEVFALFEELSYHVHATPSLLRLTWSQR